MEDRSAHVRRLIAAEVVDRNGGGGEPTAPTMQRLCQVAVRLVPALGATVSVVATDGVPQILAASDGIVSSFDGHEQVTGGGPGLEAFTTASPVLVPDLEAVDPARWPGYVNAAHGSGILAVFAFPLQVGAIRLGALEIYRGTAGPLSAEALGWGLTLADVAIGQLLDAQSAGDDAGADLPYRAEIFQAQGMVMMQLKIPLAEAMIRLRAHAFAADRALADVARDIIDRRLAAGRHPDGAGF